MKYLSLNTVFDAFCRNSECTKSKFWGLLAILQSIQSQIEPGTSYSFKTSNIAKFLENLFCFKDKKGKFNDKQEWYILFSKYWITKIAEQMCNSIPNIFDTAVWFLRNEEFKDDASEKDCMNKFIQLTGFSVEQVHELFNFDERPISFDNLKYTETDLLQKLSSKFNNPHQYVNITSEGNFITSNPGEFSRAPFIQTLYAGQQTTECLLLTQFSIFDYYIGVNNIRETTTNNALTNSYLTAMRTKPFLLLAGISGTGKSRIVKQLAYESCPNIDSLQDDPTSPGNYQLIEVKPNWHDSTEVIGYESEIGDRHYVLTPFVRFLVKAMRYETVCPFFVCMDEMNLAPVEQYFAEFLSVLESRKLNGVRITSEPLIKAETFKHNEKQLRQEFGLPSSEGDYNDVYEKLKENGLRLPSNLIVVGTVNMDETTHQFSRKVIDRAMTIEMNIADDKEPFEAFFDGEDTMHYYDNPQPKELYLPMVVQAGEALALLKAEDAEYVKTNVPELLCSLNKALDGTPFKIAYRVQNELVLYFHALREEEEHRDDSAADLLNQAMDAMLMMKVLPRIEGDEDLLEKPLKKLAEFTAAYPQASKKIAEMQGRLQGAHFTSFWP